MMLLQVCAGLDHLHSRGFAHGDLKPDNIVVARDPSSALSPPSVKLLDFGFAVMQGTPVVPLQGSPHYIAPEVISGGQSSPSSDLYSLGVILYECLAGAPPFTGPDPGAVLQAHLHARPAPIEGGSLQELHSIVYSLMSKDPAHRPYSASALHRLIRDASGDGVPELEAGPYWSAITRSCPSIIGGDLNDKVARFLLSTLSLKPPAQTRMIMIEGEKGSGRTRLLRSIALSARTLGFVTHTLTSATPGFLAAHFDDVPRREPTLLATDDVSPQEFADLDKSVRAQPSLSAPLVLVVASGTLAGSQPRFPQSSPRSGDASDRLVIRLEPLDEAGVQRFIQSIPGVQEVPDEVAICLLNETGGNPALLAVL